MSPRFDQPTYTRPARDVLQELPPQPSMPMLIEPASMPRVEHPVDEPLVAIAHRRIRMLANYFHAGWERARPDMLLRTGACARLNNVADALPARFGLGVFDAWRPLDLQAELFDAAYADPGLPEGFVSPPNPDPATPPPHLTGGTVDLTLTFDGTPLAPGAGFDDFTQRAATAALENEPGIDRDVRRMLYRSMRAEGFVVLDCEWWHFEFGTRRWAAITGAAPIYGPVEPSR